MSPRYTNAIAPACLGRIVAPLFAGLVLAACGSPSAEADAPAAPTLDSAAPVAQPAVFDPADTPLSTQELGEFPYVAPPQGYVLANPRSVDLELKYIYAGGAVRQVEGRYHHGAVFTDGGQWNETGLLRALDSRIVQLGGVRIFDGPLPAAAVTLIRDNAPKFAQDVYDPWPYRFRQYLIRTEDRLIWIEIGYGYNAEMVDLTVVEETLEA